MSTVVALRNCGDRAWKKADPNCCTVAADTLFHTACPGKGYYGVDVQLCLHDYRASIAQQKTWNVTPKNYEKVQKHDPKMFEVMSVGLKTMASGALGYTVSRHLEAAYARFTLHATEPCHLSGHDEDIAYGKALYAAVFAAQNAPLLPVRKAVVQPVVQPVVHVRRAALWYSGSPSDEPVVQPVVQLVNCARKECPCTATQNGAEGSFCCLGCWAGTPCVQPAPGKEPPHVKCGVCGKARDSQYQGCCQLHSRVATGACLANGCPKQRLPGMMCCSVECGMAVAKCKVVLQLASVLQLAAPTSACPA